MLALWDTVESQLKVYPRIDEQPVAGLDPRYVICAVVDEDQPVYDSQTQRLERTISFDEPSKTITRGWTVADYPAQPDWRGFYDHVMDTAAFENMLREAYTLGPGAFSNIVVGLRDCSSGDYGTFQKGWNRLYNANKISAQLITAAQSIAGTYKLPQEFIDLLDPS